MDMAKGDSTRSVLTSEELIINLFFHAAAIVLATLGKKEGLPKLASHPLVRHHLHLQKHEQYARIMVGVGVVGPSLPSKNLYL